MPTGVYKRKPRKPFMYKNVLIREVDNIQDPAPKPSLPELLDQTIEHLTELRKALYK